MTASLRSRIVRLEDRRWSSSLREWEALPREFRDAHKRLLLRMVVHAARGLIGFGLQCRQSMQRTNGRGIGSPSSVFWHQGQPSACTAPPRNSQTEPQVSQQAARV